MNILLVEDIIDLWETIRDYLIACDFTVDRTTTISQAKDLLYKKVFDCIVLDRMLPDWSGDELCSYIKTEYQTPVIMSTAKSQIEDKLEGFDAGADDYLAKPYDLRELEARIHALTKRSENIISTQKIGDLTINTESMQIWKNNEEIHCTNTEWIVIKILTEDTNRVISRSDLIDYIRGGEGTRWFENKLDVLISSIRKKLGKDSIETIKGFGYKFHY
jgi:two-component system, OmpR family, response regulator